MHHRGPWKVLISQSVYKDPWLELIRDEVIRPDGKPGSHTIVYVKQGVSVLAIDGEGAACLVREFHYGVGRVTIEVVSGGIDEGESAEAAAKRELREELGITAREWVDLGVVDPFTSMVNSPTRLFLARGLTFGGTDLEGTEHLELARMPFADAVAAVMDSRITHAPSCAAILKAKLWLAARE